MPSNIDKLNGAEKENRKKYLGLLLICIRINKQIKDEFHSKDILLIYKMFFANEVPVQMYFNWDKNLVNLKKLTWAWYSRRIYNLIIDLINNLEDRLIDMTPGTHLDNLYSFFNKRKENIEKQRKSHEEKEKINKKLHQKNQIKRILACISLIIIITITSKIYNNDLWGILLWLTILIWWVWIDKANQFSQLPFNPEIDEGESSVYDFIEESIYLKALCIVKYKDIIKEKIKNEMRNIDKLENKNYLEKINPFEFEELIWKALQYFGFKTKVTRKTGDKWVDIWLEKNEEKSIVQCKRFKWKISTPTIRDFIWTMQMNKIKSWYIVTTSSFSVDSLLTIEESDYKIQLIDMDGVISLMQAMNNWEKNKFDDILKESTIRIWQEWNKNYKIKKDYQRKYWLRRKFVNF